MAAAHVSGVARWYRDASIAEASSVDSRRRPSARAGVSSARAGERRRQRRGELRRQLGPAVDPRPVRRLGCQRDVRDQADEDPDHHPATAPIAIGSREVTGETLRPDGPRPN